MKVTQRKLDDGKLRLECVATPVEVNEVLQNAYIQFAQQMGLRPEKDKTVAQVAEEQMGIKNLDSIVQEQAIEGLVPYAIDKKNLTPAYPPKAEHDRAIARDREFAFTVVVLPKPNYELSSYEPVSITVQPFEVSEDEVQRHMDETAEHYAEYVADDPHPVAKGDSVKVKLECSEDGKPMPGLTTEGRTYTTGAGYMPDGFDENIIGMNVGETKEFTFEGPSLDDDGNECTQKVECRATVLEIQKKVVPAITDEWVTKYMPMYKSADDFRNSIRESLEKQGREQYDDYNCQLAASELARRFQGSIADEVYEAMREQLMNNVRQTAQQQGKTLDAFIEEQGGQQQFGMMMMMQIRELLVQGFALDALFRHEHLVLNDDDINAACRAMNPQVNPKMLRQRLEQTGRGFMLREAAERLKANNWLLEHANIRIAGEQADADKAEADAADAAE